MRPPKIRSAFLSATVLDCGAYRTQLKASIENYANVRVPLQQHWAEPVHSVVKACESHFLKQDAYLGLFGHRYGWVPPGYDPQSITRLEWSFAVQRWRRETEAPMFIFRPKPGSQADQQLQAQAEQTFDQQNPPASADDRARSRRLQQEFWAALDAWALSKSGGRTINLFRTLDELEKMGMASISHWNLDMLERAVSSGGAGPSRIPDAELGRLGRKAQFECIQEAMAAAVDADPARSLAFAVHGPEGHGQWQFALQLAAWSEFDEAEVMVPGPADAGDAATLARWACGRLKCPDTGSDALAALTQALAARLRLVDVVLVLSAFGTAPDRWQRFVQDLWQPLTAQLQAMNLPQRLLWFVIDSEPAAVAQQPALFWDGDHDDADLDAMRLVPVPELGPFSAPEVERFLKLLQDNYPELPLPAATRRQIAKAVTTTDGVPERVFGRLHNQGFWA